MNKLLSFKRVEINTTQAKENEASRNIARAVLINHLTENCNVLYDVPVLDPRPVNANQRLVPVPVSIFSNYRPINNLELFSAKFVMVNTSNS